MTTINYVASPTLSRFHASDAMVKGLMGPLGSGKSVGCCIEILTRSQKQAPGPDGVRRTRWAVVRNTYGQLKSTTIKTWQDWIPEAVCPIIYDSPIRGRMKCPLPDGTKMDMEVLFVSLDKPKDAAKVLSLELTGVWLNEAREIPFEIAKAAYSRTGRYPSISQSPTGITWTGMLMDTNPCDTDHWWYKIFEDGSDDLKNAVMEGADAKDDKRDYSWRLFRQPGALIEEHDAQGRVTGYRANNDAENVKNQQLGFQYWFRLTRQYDAEWIRVHCCGEYGSVFDGKPVYAGVYNDTFHLSPRPLGIFRGIPLLLGWDYGLTPACIIGQQAPNGQLRILREYVCERGGIKQFATDTVKPAIAQLFPGMSLDSIGDPAGEQAAQTDMTTPAEWLANLGIPTRKAPTNAFVPRRQAVLDRLTRTIDGQPAFILDPSCHALRKGFMGGYMFRRIQVSGTESMYKDEPYKNSFSHPHDALQYLVMGADSARSVQTRREAPPVRPTWGGFV